MENILLNALKINDLKLTGASTSSQKTDSNDSFDSILQGLLGTGNSLSVQGLSRSTQTSQTTGSTSANSLTGLKSSLSALSKIIAKISKILEENNGELDIKALEELLGKTLSQDEIALFKQIASKKFTLEEIQTALLEDSDTALQSLGISLDTESDESIENNLQTLISGLDKIISQLKLSLENNFTNQDITDEETLQVKTGLSNLLTLLESVKGTLKLTGSTIELAFTDTQTPVFDGYDDIEQVKKTFWTTIDQLMGNKSNKSSNAATANLLSSEIISNEDLRDLRKNIENLLQNRQSLQKLFTSDSAVDRKFVEAVLDYAEALKDNKGKAGLSALAKNLANLNTETAKSPSVTINNSLYKELLTTSTEKASEENLKTEQTGKTTQLLKTVVNENSTNTTNNNNNNNGNHLNNPYNLNNVQVIKSESATAATTAANVNQSSVLNQVSEKINFALNQGQSRVTIQLNPPSLGQIDVSLSIRNNQLQATMIAESVQVKHILESNMHQLKVTLEGQNIEVDKISVFVGNEESNFASLLRENKHSGTKNIKFTPLGGKEELDASELPKVIIADKSENLDLFA